ncbi:MAG: TSUP family transporter [Ignavibacteriaceae bacterium]
MHDPFILYSVLLLTGFFAGLVDSIAGGGGLITIPALLSLGFPPHITLGTNKFQSSFGSFTASYYYVKKGGVILKEAALGIFFTLIGAALGVWVVQQIPGKVLNNVIPFLLIAIIIYTFTKPNLGDFDIHPRLSKKVFYAVFGLLLGFYDGFFGPGVGSFWAIAFVTLLGFNFTKATGFTKVMNFTSNIVSFFLFLIAGQIIFSAGIAMAIGEVLGAKIGSGLVIKKGAKFIRPIFVAVVILTTLKLLFDRFH